MSSLTAIAFVGQNANGILAWWTQAIIERLKLHGVSAELIDMLQPDWSQRLNAMLEKGPPNFCFSFQGLGMGLEVEGRNLWTQLKVPFVSSMGDAPYQAPRLHAAVGEGLIHLYTAQDFYDFYTGIMKGKNIASVVSFGYPANPHANDIGWRDRDLELVYVKSGADPKAIRETWGELPSLLRDIIEGAVTAALAGEAQTIAQLVQRGFKSSNLHVGERLTLFLMICRQVDAYVRATRAERMAREVMRLGGHIFGDWPHLRAETSRARFHGSIPAKDLPKLYARSRILANVAPSTRTGIHERILAGFMSKAFILADESPFLTQGLEAYPSFMAVPIHGPDFADAMDARMAEIRSADMADQAQQILDDIQIRAADEFGLDRFINAMLEFLFLRVVETKNEFYAFHA
jgi:hypothetical protein